MNAIDRATAFLIGVLVYLGLLFFAVPVLVEMDRAFQEERNRRVRAFIESRWCRVS